MAGDDGTLPQTPSASAARKRTVEPPDRYRIGELLGEGGMGRVYRAHDTTLGRDVAIKVIESAPAGPDKTQQEERFVREARAAARIVHPGIAVVHDVDPHAGWLVMELVEGESLRDVVARGALAPALVRTIAAQVLAGLAAAHAGGVIHRDVKPSNIILGTGNRVKLVDFGVARLLDAEVTRTGDNLGTPAYMAPEQMRGAQVDARTDLYGLGATLYELVTGARMIAFESPGAAAMARLREACGDSALARLVARCLQADPAARFPSAKAALEALSTESSSIPAATRRRRVPVIAIAIAVVLGGGLGAGAFWLRREQPQDPRLARAFTLAQRGQNEKAAELLQSYLGEHPHDGEALAMKFLADWWQGGNIGDHRGLERTLGAKLRPALRALVRGIELISSRRETEAAAYLEAASREHPSSPEILYALGEAQWHGQHYEDAASTLEQAFLLDPRWQMALHHVVELRLTRGETARLVPLADKLRTVDASAAAALDCKIVIGDRKYAEAVTLARRALERVPPIAEIYICLAHAQALAGDLDAGMATAKKAFELWPIDLREFGGFATYAEFFLYRGQFDEYLDLLRDKPSRQRSLAHVMWHPIAELEETTPAGTGMRMPPLGAAAWILVEKMHGRDAVDVYRDYPEAEVSLFGQALWAEARGDLQAAITGYRHALEVPAKGDLRMLISHHLARVLRASGDPAGAAAACTEVISPRVYQGYRAILLPDCLLWSEDPAAWRRLADAWRGSFEHPALVEVRRRLAAP